MWAVSNKYKEYIAKKTVEYVWYGQIAFTDGTTATFDNENVDQNKSRLTRQIVKGENLEVGGVFSGELVLGLRDSAAWKISDRTYKYEESEVTLYFRLKYPDNTSEDVLCGKFIINKAERTYHTVTLTAYDDINKLNEKLANVYTGNFEPYDAISSICSAAGVTLGMTKAQIEAFPSGTRSDLKLGSYKKGVTYKKILGDICAILGVNAICDRYNRLILIKINPTSVREVGAEHRYSSSYIDYIGHYSIMYYALKNGDVMEVDDGSTSDPPIKQLGINIGKNTLLEEYDTETTSWILYGILYNNFRNVYYSPVNVTMPADPSLDVGDMISIVGGEIIGTYIKTIQTSVDPNQTYYEKDDEEFSPVTPIGTENPSAKGWYEKIVDTYIETHDAAVVEGKTYYEYTAGYTRVTPVGDEDPSEEEWYILGQQMVCTKIEMPLYGQMRIISEAGVYELEVNEYATKKEQEQQDKQKDDDEEQKKNEEDIGNLNEDVGNLNEDVGGLQDDVGGLQDDVGGLQDEIDGINSRTSVDYVAPYQTISGGISDGGNAYALRFRVNVTRDGDTVAFHAMIGFEVETTVSENNYGDCVLTVQYLLDDTVTATAYQTYGDGHQILTMNGCFKPSAGEHTFDVKFAVAGGSLS